MPCPGLKKPQILKILFSGLHCVVPENITPAVGIFSKTIYPCPLLWKFQLSSYISLVCWSYRSSVPDKRGVSGQKPDKVTYMTQQTDRKLVMFWWKLWELTRWNSVLTPRLENISGTLRSLHPPRKFQSLLWREWIFSATAHG